MATKSITRIENERLWMERITRLRSHRGSLTSFCREEGISIETLNYWRKKSASGTGVAKPSQPRRPAFVPVEVVVDKPRQSCGGDLPDPKWVAEFVLHLCGGAR